MHTYTHACKHTHQIFKEGYQLENGKVLNDHRAKTKTAAEKKKKKDVLTGSNTLTGSNATFTPTSGEYLAAAQFEGPKAGMVFSLGIFGLGYYKDKRTELALKEDMERTTFDLKEDLERTTLAHVPARPDRQDTALDLAPELSLPLESSSLYSEAEEEQEEQEEEIGRDAGDVHPLQLMMLQDTQMGRKLKHQHMLKTGENFSNATIPGQAGAKQRSGRIFFLENFGPEAALKHYRDWLRETAQVIRDKLYGGYNVSRQEWEQERRYRTKCPVIFEKEAHHKHVLDMFPDMNDPAEQDKIRWADLLGPDGQGFNESSDPLETLSESFTPSYDMLNHTTRLPKKIKAYGDDKEVEPAYMQPAMIEHLGIQPPEAVKKSVLEAMAPLTEEEHKIKIRGDDAEDAYYNRSLDDGSFRLRPGTRIQSPSMSEEGGDTLYVPKVGKHRPAIVPTADNVIERLMNGEDLMKDAARSLSPQEPPQANDPSSSHPGEEEFTESLDAASLPQKSLDSAKFPQKSITAASFPQNALPPPQVYYPEDVVLEEEEEGGDGGGRGGGGVAEDGVGGSGRKRGGE
jgi:hypothetical protein